MLIVEIIRYLKRRADKRPVYLKNFVDQGHHHGRRTSEPSVAIIIPTRDKVELLRACVESVFEKTTYKNYSIIVVDNQSVEAGTLEYLDELSERQVSILKYPHKFNYSAICNSAASTTTAEYLCFLNNDTEVIEPNWLGYMIDHAIQSGVGVVGSKLLYPDGTIQHLGVDLGYTGAAGHAYSGEFPNSISPTNVAHSCFEVSAVTFACSVVNSKAYAQLEGLRVSLRVGFNDVDYCVRTRQLGAKNIVCGGAELIHHEYATRPKVWHVKGFFRAFSETLLFLKAHELNTVDSYFGRMNSR